MNAPPIPHSHPLDLNRLYLKRKLLKLVGAQYHIHGPGSGQEVFLANKKGLKLKEDIRISRNGIEEIHILARQIMDFKASYDVFDLSTTPSVRIGVLKRKGWASIVRDEWVVYDANEVAVGSMLEDSMLLALVRRFLTALVPQNYDMFIGSTKVVDFKQNFNPFTYHLNIDFLVPSAQFDRRLGLAAAVLLASIEGRQSG